MIFACSRKGEWLSESQASLALQVAVKESHLNILEMGGPFPRDREDGENSR